MSARAHAPSSLLSRPKDEPADEAPSAAGLAAADRLISIVGRIRRAGRRQGKPVELAQLTGAQLELLRLVRRQPGVSVADAARELRLAANTVSTLVSQLTQTGLLTRRVSDSDRRMAMLDLSAETGEQMDAWRDRRLAALAAAIEGLEPGERERLLEALPALARVAEDLLEGGFEE